MKYLVFSLLSVVSMAFVSPAHASKSCDKEVAKKFARFLGPGYRLSDTMTSSESGYQMLAFYVSDTDHMQISYNLKYESEKYDDKEYCLLTDVRIYNFGSSTPPPR